MIAHQAGGGQRHVQMLGGGKREFYVLEAQRHLETGGLIVRDDRAIGFVYRG